jgi:molecular chaperone GrpE (heat shock protein)
MVSLWQVRQLQQGKLHQMRLVTLLALSRALGLSLVDLLTAFGEPLVTAQENFSVVPSETGMEDAYVARQEYDRLQAQLHQQQETITKDIQRHSLDTLESLLVQLPTALYAAEQNPQLSAKSLAPLLTPLHRLLQQWGVEPIAAVGDQIPYDPQHHQLIDSSAEPGDLVRVRYVGYRWQGNLLHRSQVSLVITKTPDL